MPPCTGGRAGLGVCTSVRVFRMSPSRCIEMPTCWKSVHSCASRITGPATLPDSMLKAISCPTVSCPSITSRAPSHMVATVTSLLTKVTPPLATVPIAVVRKAALT